MTGARGSGGEGEGSLHVKVELLQQIDGVASGSGLDPTQTLLILGATNRPWDLDEAFRRRFQKRILVRAGLGLDTAIDLTLHTHRFVFAGLQIALPDDPMREALFRRFMGGKAVNPDVSFATLASRTAGFSCADISNVCKDAAYGPFRDFTVQMHAEVGNSSYPMHCHECLTYASIYICCAVVRLGCGRNSHERMAGS